MQEILESILERLNTIQDPISYNWLDIRQAAEYLKISQSTIRKLISENGIPFKRVPNGKTGTASRKPPVESGNKRSLSYENQ
jgi:excisionase family DNA binding protein